MYNYKRLEFFKKEDIVSDMIHEITKRFPKFETYELGSQMRRAADSIILNIAEGGGKKTVAEMTTYLRHSLGSVKELEVGISKVDKLGYLENGEVDRLLKELDIIGKMIVGFMRKLKERGDRITKSL